MVDTSRRRALQSAAALLTLAGCSATRPRAGALLPRSGSEESQSPDADIGLHELTLWYRQPAREWVEALPLGNGRLGAMVFGGVPLERLQINDDTLYAGGPYRADNPEARAALPEVRRLIFEERYLDALALAEAKVMARPLRQMSYQPAGDLLLSFEGLDETADYVRELDLDAAMARTRFTCGGVRYSREVFASPVDQVIAMRLRADQPGKLRFDLALQSAQKSSMTHPEDDTLVLSGMGPPLRGIEGATKFEMRVKVLTKGGAVSPTSTPAISVHDADEAVILMAVATSYKRYDDVSGDPAALTTQQIAAAARKPFSRLASDHIAEHRRLFRRVSIDLGTSEAAHRPTDERVRESANLDDPALASLYYQYGRYLLISSSRPGTQPANLQGIWNDRTDPPWDSKWTININTEMNYWPAEPTQLGECVLPLVAMVKDLSVTGAKTARDMYGARGWVVHHNTDLWRATAPIDSANPGLWPMGGAWLCRHLWDHYDYGRDRRFLEEIYPLMKGCAEFFLDTLVTDPKSGGLVTCPSLSPENRHHSGVTLCAGPAMDRQILRDLFAQCIEAASILGVDEEFRAQLNETRRRLPADRIGSAGQLQEWLEDWDLSAPEIHHRHVSHLFAVYPSSQINFRDTPELTAAARKSLEIRGDEATGWGIGWRLNLWARFQAGDHAHNVLQMLLRPERTYPNLFDAHPPFQIDGNFGGTSGMTEMLLQSWGGTIHLLPALPKAWPSGHIKGLCARGGCAVDIAWSNGALDEAVIRSRVGGRYDLRYGAESIQVNLAPGASARLRLAGTRLQVS